MCLVLGGAAAAGAGMSAGALSTLNILNTVASVGSVVASYVGQMQQAATQNALYEANRAAANDATQNQYRAAMEQQRLDMANDSRKINAYQLQAREAQGTALASSQNEGNSLNMTLRDLMGRADRNIALTQADAAIRDQNYLNQMEAIGAQGVNRINSVQRGQDPSALSAILSGLGAYGQAQLSSKQFDYTDPMAQVRKDVATSAAPTIPKIGTKDWFNDMNMMTRRTA